MTMNEVKKMSVPKLSKRTIQDSKQGLIQIFRINHYIEPQTGNWGSLIMHTIWIVNKIHILTQF